MTKIKELQAQVQSLQAQATRALNERDTWQKIAATRSTDIQRLYQRLDDQSASHGRALTEAANVMAAESLKVIQKIQHNADLDLIAAQRDSIGQAYKYLVDSVTANK